MLVEIFPVGSFTLDYQLQAEIAGVKHYAYDAGLGVIGGSLLKEHIKCGHDVIRPQDKFGNLNSIIRELNVSAFMSSLRIALESLVGGKAFPPSDWESSEICQRRF